MLTKRLSLMAVAAAFAVSSSLAMLQSARPALADADDHHPKIHRHVGYHWMNGQWVPNTIANTNRGGHWVNGQWVSNTWHAHPGKHHGSKHKKNHDHDHDGR